MRQQFQDGTNQIAQFQVAGSGNMTINYPDNFFTYKVQLYSGANNTGNVLLKPITQPYGSSNCACQVSGMSAGALPAAGGAVCSFVYRRNSLCVFSKVSVLDYPTNELIDEIGNPALVGQLQIFGQGEDFRSRSYKDCLKFGATPQTFRDSSYYWPKTGNDMCPSTLIPAIYGDAMLIDGPQNTTLPSGASVVFPEVYLQQQYEWPSTATAKDAGEIRIIPFSDYLENNTQAFSVYNRHTIEFIFQVYAGAYTDVLATQDSAGNWSYSTNAQSFQITDFKYHTHKFYINTEVMGALNKMVTGVGIQIPYEKLFWNNNSNFPHTQASLTVAVNDTKIKNLERLLIVIRRQADAKISANYDNCMFRNMSSTFFSDTTHIMCPTNGSSAASSFSSSSALAVSTNYNGIWRISGKWSENALPDRTFVYMKPYKFDLIKNLSQSIFIDGDSQDSLTKYQYEGIDTSNGLWNNSNTSFFLGIDLRTLKGAEKSGISISQSPLTITIELYTLNGVVNTTDFAVDLFNYDGRVLEVLNTGVRIL